jgi:hypothetical protein
VVGPGEAPARAVDRAGRDVRAALAAADGVAFGSDDRVLSEATGADPQDWIETAVAVPPGVTKLALVLKARNSLLNTVLFYDVMLAPSGPRALDWLGGDLSRIDHAVELGRWVRRHMGLRVEVWRDGAFRETVRIADPGPIAWHDVAAVIPVMPQERALRVRLSFLADGWRIDRLAVSPVRLAQAVHLPVESVTGPDGKPEPGAERSLREPDTRYLRTSPGQRFTVAFRAGSAPAGTARTFLLSSQGYYTEWIRGDWLRSGSARAFHPSDQALDDAFRRWRASRASFEERFAQLRVPVL